MSAKRRPSRLSAPARMKWQPEPFDTPTLWPFRSATVRIDDSSGTMIASARGEPASMA